MKQFSILLLAIASCCLLQAKDRVVKQPPFIVRNSSTIEIDRVVVSDTATVLEIKAYFRPNNWIRISSESYLLADNGEKYPIRSGNGITLDKEFWMPESGEASFSLIFPLLPPTVKVIDFIESDCEDCFKIWGIHLDGKLPKLDLPVTVKAKKTITEESLPAAKFTGGKAILNGYLLGYQKHYQIAAHVLLCNFLTGIFEQNPIKVNEDGTFSMEVELHAPSMVTLKVGDSSVKLFLVPGRETTVAVNLREINRMQSKLLKDHKSGEEQVYCMGAMGRLNNELNEPEHQWTALWEGDQFLKEIYNMSADTYKAYCQSKFEKVKADIQGDKTLSEAGRQLLLIENQYQYALSLSNITSYLMHSFVKYSGLPEREAYQKFQRPVQSENYYDYVSILNKPEMLFCSGYSQMMKYLGYEIDVKLDGNMKDIFSYILSSDKVSAADAQTIKEFSADLGAGKEKPVHMEKMDELRNKYSTLFSEYSAKRMDYIINQVLGKYIGSDKGIFFDLKKVMTLAQKISDFQPMTEADFQSVRQLSDPYYINALTAMNDRLLETIEANKKKTGYTVNEAGEVKDEDLFYSITSKFKGKVILVDFWATWCGPCKMAMKQMKPMKEDLAGKDIVYVFIAGENSPKETWDNMIPDIHGEHYRVTEAQWNYLSKQFSIQGVPTYIIVDKEGGITQKYTGFPGVDTVKKELLKALEK